ncbi:hypothetical protein SAMN05216410_1390 [Sanguibacter gelidistatuariae]|uniref:Uncharacterized protein n=1 Tax=Sanguibacter gelidistatuariae TaxID=1814289 RepID=A0A1G6JQ96_9MICO|nr:hypothetical protein [Sanguibacter gelidistatuariae]SDC20899.1 hypothetical protein SAMN05216410_1390 [Sanguibacter gelidistatuariae]
MSPPKELAVAELLSRGTHVALDVVANVRATEEAITALADRTREVTTADIEHLQHVIEPPLVAGLRTRRALIHTALRRTDALRNTLIPISTVFAGDPMAYISGLSAFRADPPRLDDWIIAFAQAAELAAGNAVRLSDDLADLDRRVRVDLVVHRQARGASQAKLRSDAVVLRILDTLATNPVLTIETAARKHGVSTAAAHRALVELANAGILGRTKDHKGKLICWTADRHLALVALTERSNRVGAGDTGVRGPRLGPPVPAIDQSGRLRGHPEADVTSGPAMNGAPASRGRATRHPHLRHQLSKRLCPTPFRTWSRGSPPVAPQPPEAQGAGATDYQGEEDAP